MVMVVMAAAIYCAILLFFEGVERRDGLRWMDIGSEFGLYYWCWIFLAVFLVVLVVFFIHRFFREGGIG